MLKIFKKLCICLLVLPLIFSFSACKKKNDPSNNNGTQNEQPGTQPGGPGGSENPPSSTSYKVSFDYNLPERLEGLIADSEVSSQVGEATALPTISDARISLYFKGWYDAEDQLVQESVSGEANSTISLKAKWHDGFSRYYYTDGLTFSISGTNAMVASYSGTAEKVYLPTYYTSNTVDYLVRIVGIRAFENSNVKEVSFGTDGMNIQTEAFKNSKLETVDFSDIYNISDSAFAGTKLKSAELGKFVQTLGVSVFANCTDLESVDFSKVTTLSLKNVSTNMFNGCTKLKTVKLNNYITEISSNAFVGCLALEDFSFISESNVEKLSNYAFSGCSALEEIELPSRINDIGYDVFAECTGLRKISLGRIHSMGADTFTAFFGDLTSSLKEIELVGAAITEIPNYYFTGCASLEKFVMSDSVVSIGINAFSGCSKLADITLSSSLDPDRFQVSSVKDTAWFKNLEECLIIKDTLLLVPSAVSGEVVIAEGVKKIVASAFEANTTVTKVKIPSTVEFIGEKAFYECANLETVEFAQNNKLVEIKNNTFYNCKKITSINLGNCKVLTTIGEWAFRNALSVETLIIPSTITTLGIEAFRSAGVAAFEVAAENANYVSDAGVLYKKNDAAETLTLVAYPKLKTNKTFVIQSNVVAVSSYAFNGSKNLLYVYIANPTITIDFNAFTLAGKNGLEIFSECSSIENASAFVTVYNLASTDVYNVSEDDKFTISLKPDAVLASGNYYAKIANGNDFVIVNFIVNVSGETVTIVSQNKINQLFEF